MAFENITDELPGRIPGVGLSENSDQVYAIKADGADLINGFEDHTGFLEKLAAKSKAYLKDKDMESFKDADVDAMIESLKRDPKALDRLRKAYVENFDNDDEGNESEKDTQSDEELKIAVKAQMLLGQLASAGNDKEKIQNIINELKQLKSNRGAGAGAVQSVIDAAQGQAVKMFIDALASVATSVAGGVVSAVNAAKDYLFGNHDHKQFLDSLKSLKPEHLNDTKISKDGVFVSDKSGKIDELDKNFKMLHSGKGELQLLKLDGGLGNISKDEQNKFMGAVENLMSLKSSLAGIEGKDTTKANNEIVKEVRSKMESIVKLQEKMVKDQAEGIKITDERRKELNADKVLLKTFIQEKVLKAPAAMSTGKSSAVTTSGLARSTETTIVPDPNKLPSLSV
jgi:hypothetical protein